MTSKSEIKTREALSLDNCDSEPVHIPGTIQGFAVLIATDDTLTNITHCSDNAASVFGKPTSEIVGTALSDLFDAKVIHDLNNTLSLSSARLQRERVTEITFNKQAYEIWAHVSHDIPVIEIEPIQNETLTQNQSILNVRSLLARINQDQDIQKSLNEAVTGLRFLSGYDRVLAYEFDKNGDGEVKAEARGPQLSPFLGLRFPKWDIPNQARAIMKKLPLRVIANVNADPVKIVSDDRNRPPLDITFAASRGVSPIHMEYLRNMGVGGSMTLSIVVRGELWGLFAFHHSSPRNVGPGLRGAAELFAQFFSLQMEQRLSAQLNQTRAVALEYQSILLDAVDNVSDLSELISEIATPLCNLVDADGMALISNNTVFEHGDTPSPALIKSINDLLLIGAETDTVVTDSMSEHGFETGSCAGVIALLLDEGSKNSALFFRNEASRSVNWAGAPKKDIIEDESGLRLMPRGSFKAYQESVRKKSRPWDQTSIFAAEQARIALTKADTALFRRLSHKVERQRSIYIAELNHRVRNILSLIRSLSRRSQETSHSLETYAKALESRISALGAAHDLAANRITNGIVIHELFKLEAKPFENTDKPQFFLQGEKFVLRSDTAPIFALIVHELMTNSVKHGALSSPSGQVIVDIKESNDGVKIIWTETGGPETRTPSQTGFGLGLIQNAVPYELDGQSDIDFRPEGLRAEFWLPIKLLRPLTPAFDKKPKQQSGHQKKQEQIPRNMLVVEDSLMLAIDMSDMLKQIGVETIEKCANIRQAKQALERFSPDMAILDISLKEEQSFEIAFLLLEKNIPFCFATGYGSEFPIPKELQGHLVLTKPVDIKILSLTINKLYK